MIIVTIDVFCDRCSNWCCNLNIADGKIQARRARSEAREYGWIQVKMDDKLLDLCPDCARRLVEKR